jgi:hypothetical protein
MSGLQYKWSHKYSTILQYFIFHCRQKLHQFFTIHIPPQGTALTARYAPPWHKHQPDSTGVIFFKWRWQKFDITLWAMKDKIFKNCKIFVDWFIFKYFNNFIDSGVYFNCTHAYLWQNLLYLACLLLYLPDDDLTAVEICTRDVSDKWLFIINCAICWNKQLYG